MLAVIISIFLAVPVALGVWLWISLRKISAPRSGFVLNVSRRVEHAQARKPAPISSEPAARQLKPQESAAVCFVVGKAYRCRDSGYGETAHRIIRRQRSRVQMTCDVIEYCSDYRPWRKITVVDGVETLEKGNIRADDEYLGPQNFAQSYIDAARNKL